MQDKKPDLAAFLKSPVVRKAVTNVVNFLTDIDEEGRQAAVDAALLYLRQPLLAPVLDRLIGRLRHGSPAMRGRAAASLAELGPLAAPAVAAALARARHPLLRRRLAGVLALMGPRLGRAGRAEAVRALEAVRASTTLAALASDCAAAITALGADPGGQ